MKALNFRVEFFLTPLRDIHFTPNLQYEPEAQGNRSAVLLLAIIGGFILFMAWINYINLTTASLIERTRELAIRKIVGAERIQLVVQLITETLLVNLAALLLSTVLVIVLYPAVNEFLIGDGAGMMASPLWKSWMFWIMLTTIFVVGVLLTGGYPAFVMSGLKPALAIQGKFFQSTDSLSVRKVLLTLQYVLSLLLIGGTLTVYRQLSYMQHTDPGYSRNQVVVIRTPSAYGKNDADRTSVFTTFALQNPKVRTITRSSDIPGKALTDFNSVWRSTNVESTGAEAYMMQVDERFMPAYGVQFAAGRNFSTTDSVTIHGTEHAKLLINETLARSLGYRRNGDALNQELSFRPDGRVARGRIVGVVKDYHQRSMRERYDPIIYYYPSAASWKYISVVTQGKEAQSVLSVLEKKYKSMFPGNGFDYFFLDDYFSSQYVDDLRFGKIFALFTGIAIVVACLGLLGLAALLISMRLREIGIRKVLGASVSCILLLFSKQFLKLIVWAAIVAVPLTYYAAEKWLDNYAFRTGVNWTILIIPTLLLMFITLVTVVIQSWTAARSNPVKTLKTGA